MRASAMFGVLALALAGCGGAGGSAPSAPVLTPTPAPTATPPAGVSARGCATKTASSQELYIAYADHIEVYALAASGSDCPNRTIDSVAQAPTTLQGIAIGGGRLFALLKPPPGTAATTQIRVYDAASGSPQPENTIAAQDDGEGSIAYASGVPAVYVASFNALLGPDVESYAPAASLRNGDPRQNKQYVAGNRGSLAVAADGTVYLGVGGGVQVFGPNASDTGAPGDQNFQPPRPDRTFGDTSPGLTPAGIALASDGTAYVATHAPLDITNSSITVYPPNATSTTTPVRTLKISWIRSIAVDANNNLIVLHNELMETFAPGGTPLLRTVTAAPTTAGTSALAVGP